MTLKTVKVPKEFEPIFAEAEKNVGKFFDSMERDPTKGMIKIAGERYILVRAESLFVSFVDHMIGVLEEKLAMDFLYSFSKIIGKSDAKNFHSKMNLKEPIEKLSAGPVHFSYTGWAFVDISPESRPTPDENYFLLYDHPNTFESVSVLATKKRATRPVCVFSAGYSAGWCSESFGLNLDAVEIKCKAKGDEACRFIMAPKDRLDEYLKKHLQDDKKD